MALLTNTAEGGTNGTGATTGTTGGGSGDSFATSIPGASTASTCVFSTAQKAHGSLSYLFTTKPSDSSYLQWTMASPGASLSIRFYLYQTTTPSTTSLICQIRNGGQAAQIGLGSDLRLRVQNAVSGDLTNAAGADWDSISLNTWYRIELVVTKGTSGTDGRIQAKVFPLDSTTPVATMTLDNTATNAGTADFTQVRFGRAGGAATAADQVYYIDDMAAQESSSFLGPVGSNIPPAVTPVQPTYTFVEGASGTFAWNEADSDGTITGRTVTHVSGPDNPSLSSPTATSRSATWATQGIHVYKIVATDDDAADSADAFITVVVTGTSARPTSVITNTGPWTNEGGAGSIEAALADESATTLAQTPDNPSGAVLTVECEPVGLGLVTVVTSDKATSASPPVTRTVALMQGATVIATGTPFALTTSAVTHSFTTTTGEAAAITDRSALRIRVTDSV